MIGQKVFNPLSSVGSTELAMIASYFSDVTCKGVSWPLRKDLRRPCCSGTTGRGQLTDQ